MMLHNCNKNGKLLAQLARRSSLSQSISAARRTMITRRVVYNPIYVPEWAPKGAEEYYEGFRANPVMHNPVTSAHMIDLAKQEPSALDSVAVDPSSKSIVHARYGDLGEAAAAIPMEFLALLHPAAIGAAALRQVLEQSKDGSGKGTVLVYGASQASGWAATQIANSIGHAVVAVVDGTHSGNDDFCEMVKFCIDEPGTMVPEEYAISKKNFKDLVESIVKGDAGVKENDPNVYLEEFKALFINQSEVYPDTLPAAVPEENFEFEFMEKDREHWDTNISTYYSQFPSGAPPVDPAKLNEYFTTEQYEVFRDKFWQQTTAVISGADPPFSAPHLVHELISQPEQLRPERNTDFPYYLSLTRPRQPSDVNPTKAGGPVVGAIIYVTPDLAAAMARINQGKTLREKIEAMAFLSEVQKGAFKAAASVAAQAKAGPVVFVDNDNTSDGENIGIELVKPTDQDVQTALKAMDIDDQGKSALNYFVQVYRANDTPFYEDYSVFRASEPLAGPRQIIVTK